MNTNSIFIKGARENNLKNIDIEIPRDKLVVITGLSGSGKSSLAFDTIYAEGQRRYVESLSSYARQFLGQMEKPDIDYIEGLSPAISIDQKTTSRNPRSTVGTVTEIHDYLRLLYARIGIPHCHICGNVIKQQTIDQMVDQITAIEEGSRIQILAPVVRGRKGEYTKLIEDIRKSGFVRIRIDGITYEINDEISINKNKKHTIDIIIDRLIIKGDMRKRLTDSIETALNMASGLLTVDVVGKEELTFSQNFSCPDCGVSIEELTPRMFSFNNPYGACPTCSGLGTLMNIDPDLIIPNKKLSLAEGAINVIGWNTERDEGWLSAVIKGMAVHYHFNIETPVEDLPQDIYNLLMYGTKGEKFKISFENSYGVNNYDTSFEGFVPGLERRYRQTSSDGMKIYYEGFMSDSPCPDCKGARLKKETLAVTVADKNIDVINRMPVGEAKNFFNNIKLSDRDMFIANQIFKEIKARLDFLVDVGLEYLSLSRSAGSLSGGEAQRIRLATQIGSGLMGVLYILDEPSIGLHQRDNEKLLATLKRLRDLGNTLIVVEHDEDTMYAADHIIDIGPGAGIHGGKLVAQGDINHIKNCVESVTGQYLSGAKKIDIPGNRKPLNGKWLKIKGCKENNLKDIDVDIPLGVFVSVTGVSGSGKSSLINEIVYKRLAAELNRTKTKPGRHSRVEGIEYLDKVINIDQSPIGRTPRSNPATYTGVFDHIREMFANTQDAKMRGYKSGRFSFNVKGGRCEACSGDGIIKIEMHFLADIYVPCEVCKGKRYNRETLEVRYKGKNIAEILDMTVEDALAFFENIPQIRRKMETLYDVGLGYIKVGQSSTTLSGGEAQRVKLATELSKRSTGRTLYILDEPTTGLHIADVHKLIYILQRLVEGGNSVIVIEHNLDVIKCADYIIDMGPEGGLKGGTVIANGTPEQIADNKISYTGGFLSKILKKY